MPPHDTQRKDHPTAEARSMRYLPGSVFKQQAVFMAACGQSILAHNPEQAELYATLCAEEWQELMDGLATLNAAPTDINAKAEVLDAILDNIVVLIGLGVSLGLPLAQGWDEVMRSNMAKIDPTTGKVLKRDDGKVLKPEGWMPPDLVGVLRANNL